MSFIDYYRHVWIQARSAYESFSIINIELFSIESSQAFLALYTKNNTYKKLFIGVYIQGLILLRNIFFSNSRLKVLSTAQM